MTDVNCWPLKPSPRNIAPKSCQPARARTSSPVELNRTGLQCVGTGNRARTNPMRYMSIAAALALAAGLGLTAASAQPSSRQPHVRIVEDGGRTVYTYTDEYGRRHTRVIIQRRSYLDPGTAALPSDRNTLDYVQH